MLKRIIIIAGLMLAGATAHAAMAGTNGMATRAAAVAVPSEQAQAAQYAYPPGYRPYSKRRYVAPHRYYGRHGYYYRPYYSRPRVYLRLF